MQITEIFQGMVRYQNDNSSHILIVALIEEIVQ